MKQSQKKIQPDRTASYALKVVIRDLPVFLLQKYAKIDPFVQCAIFCYRVRRVYSVRSVYLVLRVYSM